MMFEPYKHVPATHLVSTTCISFAIMAFIIIKYIIICYPNDTVMHRLAIGGLSPTSTIQHEYIWHRIVSPIFCI